MPSSPLRRTGRCWRVTKICPAGTNSAPRVGECRSCRGEATGVAVAEVREIFETRPTDGETYPLTGDHVDLEPMVRDAVVLSLPLAPLCAEDCPGPAPEVVEAVTAADPGPAPDETGSAAAPPTDPRWSALDELRYD